MPTGGQQWVPDAAGIAAYERRDPALYAELMRLAQRGVNYARAAAPVGSPVEGDEHAGAYRDSIAAKRDPDGIGVVFYSDDPKAHWIEYGAAHMTRQQILTRATEQMRP